MTASGRQRIARIGLAVCLWVVLGLPLSPPRAATTERIVIDPVSGLAISGFDPVSYFTDGAPRLGGEQYELQAQGAVWRFRNAGNRAAFAAHPHVYSPVYGGYDPLAVARGVATAGHPEIWAIAGKRLYLFYDEKARAAFLADPEGAIRRAEEKWPQVLQRLVP